ncbi:unnamed protein product [Tetraodon nigroviridis]|uniref:(spotted green pufferfish) hypothetical protein n=1 Tax=Tetraodon nigroviridis TaxID=99883 RepID=Q4RYB6_TETNG|nr:unnamed protein product [Tetraodon nigroviridis]
MPRSLLPLAPTTPAELSSLFPAAQIQATGGAISILPFIHRRCPELAFGDKMETVVETMSISQVCCRLSTGVL